MNVRFIFHIEFQSFSIPSFARCFSFFFPLRRYSSLFSRDTAYYSHTHEAWARFAFSSIFIFRSDIYGYSYYLFRFDSLKSAIELIPNIRFSGSHTVHEMMIAWAFPFTLLCTIHGRLFFFSCCLCAHIVRTKNELQTFRLLLLYFCQCLDDYCYDYGLRNMWNDGERAKWIEIANANCECECGCRQSASIGGSYVNHVPASIEEKTSI